LRDEPLEHFLEEGLIDGVIRPLKRGKEASVHLCRSNPRTTGETLAALKIYHPLDRRDFRDDMLYRDGEFIKERRMRVALDKKTMYGREVQGALWVRREWESLRTLSAAGLAVPRPIEGTEDAILMTYVGDEDVAAPRLHEHEHEDRDELDDLWDQVRRSILRMLQHDIVHGDLSAYNILVWESEVTVIDFPQAVDAKKNRHAQAFLERDVRRVGAWFERRGVRMPWDRIAHDLWTGWLFAELVPEELRDPL
jgi:RIO kinase 1